MTGVEAISNGVPAFKPPEEKNAAATLVIMAGLCVMLFLGTTLLAHAYHVLPSEQETVVSQLARAVFGGRGLPTTRSRSATMLILVLAANTAYADFPRLASIMARDRFLPRQFMNQGDRLAFSNGILVLSVLAAMLMVGFGGDTHSLIPLYMIGVFVSFSLSQTGMFLKWRREREGGWRDTPSSTGSARSSPRIVLVIVAVTKFTEGAWLIVAVTPLLVLHFRSIRRHYETVGAQLTLKDWAPDPETPRHRDPARSAACTGRWCKALRYARSLSPTCARSTWRRIRELTAEIEAQWETWGHGVAAGGARSPYRSLLRPLLEYIDGGRRRAAGQLRDRGAARVRARALVAPPPPQPARPADQGRAAVQAEHDRDQRAVPPGQVTASASPRSRPPPRHREANVQGQAVRW